MVIVLAMVGSSWGSVFRVLTPNGGETLISGSVYNMTWVYDATIQPGVASVFYSIDNGNNWITIGTVYGYGSPVMSYSWTVPPEYSQQCLVRVGNDTSNDVFTIWMGVTLLTPNGTEELHSGSICNITWDSENAISLAVLEYSTNNGLTWKSIDTVPDTGSYQWMVPRENSNQCLVRVSDATYSNVNDVSDDVFSIVFSGTLTLTVPNGGEKWRVGNTHYLRWDYIGLIPEVLIEYSVDNGTYWYDIATVPNTRAHEWTVPVAISDACLVRISDTEYPSLNDTSDDVFSIWLCATWLTADLNDDCFVNWEDFLIFAGQWLDCGDPFNPECQ